MKFPSQRAAAESAASGLTGVRNIKDEIGLVFDVDAEDVTRLVKEALDRHAVPLDDSHVVASAGGNTVTLIGHVRTPEQRDAVAVTPRNSASNPAQMISSAARSRTRSWASPRSSAPTRPGR